MRDWKIIHWFGGKHPASRPWMLYELDSGKDVFICTALTIRDVFKWDATTASVIIRHLAPTDTETYEVFISSEEEWVMEILRN